MQIQSHLRPNNFLKHVEFVVKCLWYSQHPTCIALQPNMWLIMDFSRSDDESFIRRHDEEVFTEQQIYIAQSRSYEGIGCLERD